MSKRVICIHGFKGNRNSFPLSFINKFENNGINVDILEYNSEGQLKYMVYELYNQIIFKYNRIEWESSCILAHSMGGILSILLIRKIKNEMKWNNPKFLFCADTPWYGINEQALILSIIKGLELGTRFFPLVFIEYILNIKIRNEINDTINFISNLLPFGINEDFDSLENNNGQLDSERLQKIINLFITGFELNINSDRIIEYARELLNNDLFLIDYRLYDNCEINIFNEGELSNYENNNYVLINKYTHFHIGKHMNMFIENMGEEVCQIISNELHVM